MQTLTIAIGQRGIEFFCQQFVASPLLHLISNMQVPNRLIDVGSFQGSGSGMGTDYSDVKIELTSGRLVGFQPAFRSVTQQTSGSEFILELAAPAFSASYHWEETGRARECMADIRGGASCQNRKFDHNYDYSPGFGELRVLLTTAFQFSAAHNAYEIVSHGSNVVTGAVSANIPSSSVVRTEIQGCASTEVSSATRQSVSEINFASAIAELIPPLLHSIPGSGDLGHGIAFDFSLGDSGLQFPTQAGRNGIQIGVVARARYGQELYPQLPSEVLALPTVPASSDPNHLQTYISSYSINGLQWAFFRADLLKAKADTGNIPNPDALKCATYVSAIPALAPYSKKSMHADIAALNPPTVVFQLVWEINDVTLASIKAIPGVEGLDEVFSDLSGNSYLERSELEDELAEMGVSAPLIPEIVKRAQVSGMVVRQDLQFKVFINASVEKDADLPYFEFSVARVDLLSNLRLGVVTGTTAQTLQFDYQKNNAVTTFLETNIPKFAKDLGNNFGSILWTMVESQYDTCLVKMGEKGVPVPMMNLFKFVFDEAQTSIQSGFVSIKAKVRL